MRAQYLLLFLFLVACGTSNTRDDSSSSGGGTEVGSLATNGENFYKRYTGTIGGEQVVVQLTVYKGCIQGSYCYTSLGQDIVLRNTANSMRLGNELYLKEIPSENTPQGDSAAALWTLTLSRDKATGTLRTLDGQSQADIDLTEDYTNGSTILNADWLADSIALDPTNSKSPKAVSTYGYLMAKGGIGDWLYRTLRQQIVPGAAQADDMKNALTSAMASYFAAYRRENEPLLKKTDLDLQAITLAYRSDISLFVRFNEDAWVVTELFSTESTGGVHSNYSSSFLNIDLSTRRTWSITDIITDTTMLRPILNDAAIAHFRLKQGQGIEGHLFVDAVPPTPNVFISARGLSFVYNPYEIGAYSDGQITLYIPYTKLMSLLTPAFKQRMKLSEHSGVAML